MLRLRYLQGRFATRMIATRIRPNRYGNSKNRRGPGTALIEHANTNARQADHTTGNAEPILGSPRARPDRLEAFFVDQWRWVGPGTPSALALDSTLPVKFSNPKSRNGHHRRALDFEVFKVDVI